MSKRTRTCVCGRVFNVEVEAAKLGPTTGDVTGTVTIHLAPDVADVVEATTLEATYCSTRCVGPALRKVADIWEQGLRAPTHQPSDLLKDWS